MYTSTSATISYSPTLRMGRLLMKARTASREAGSTYCPSGLLMSEHTLARRLLGATPALQVRRVSVRMRLRMSSATCTQGVGTQGAGAADVWW